MHFRHLLLITLLTRKVVVNLAMVIVLKSKQPYDHVSLRRQPAVAWHLLVYMFAVVSKLGLALLWRGTYLLMHIFVG